MCFSPQASQLWPWNLFRESLDPNLSARELYINALSRDVLDIPGSDCVSFTNLLGHLLHDWK